MQLRLIRIRTILAVLAALAATADAAPADVVDIGAYKGKVVVLDFWASWCVPCRRSFPWMNEMQARYADDGLVIIAVNLDNYRADAERFLEEFPADFEIAYDPGADLARAYGVQAMPSSFIIGRDGEVAHTHLGFKVRRMDEYEAAIVGVLRGD